MASGRIVVDGENVFVGDRPEFHEWEQLPSRNDYADSPGYLYNTDYPSSMSIQPVLLQTPLLDFALPHYSDVYQAIRDWIGLRQFHGPSDARIGRIYLFLPECRAHLGRFESASGRLKVAIAPGAYDSDREFRLNGSWTIPDGIMHISSPVPGSALSVEIEIPSGATGIDLYLMDRTGAIFDYHQETPSWNFGQERILPASTEGNAVDLFEVMQPDYILQGPEVSIEPAPRSDTGRDEIVATRLRQLDPALADSYEQAIQDVADGQRITYRGVAAELREVLTGVLHRLAPDGEVQATEWYREARKTGTKKETTPTRVERTKFILRGRGLGSAAADASEAYTALIEERLAKVVDATYRRGAAATHSGTEREEVANSIRYMNALLCELLSE